MTDAALRRGSRPTYRRPATRLPHFAPVGVATAQRFHAPGDEPGAGSNAKFVSGVPVPAGTADASDPDNWIVLRYSGGMKPTETPSPTSHIGHVKNGVVVLDAHLPLAEGQAVRVEPLSPADLAADREHRVRQLRQLFDEWTEEDGKLSDDEAGRLHHELDHRQRLQFRSADV